LFKTSECFRRGY